MCYIQMASPLYVSFKVFEDVQVIASEAALAVCICTVFHWCESFDEPLGDSDKRCCTDSAHISMASL